MKPYIVPVKALQMRLEFLRKKMVDTDLIVKATDVIVIAAQLDNLIGTAHLDVSPEMLFALSRLRQSLFAYLSANEECERINKEIECAKNEMAERQSNDHHSHA